jgi:hypothetical protein
VIKTAFSRILICSAFIAGGSAGTPASAQPVQVKPVMAVCSEGATLIDGKCYVKSKVKPRKGVTDLQKCPGKIFRNDACYTQTQINEFKANN